MFVFYQPCAKYFEDFYTHELGSGLNYHQGAISQKGYGFGGLFQSVFRATVPFFRIEGKNHR